MKLCFDCVNVLNEGQDICPYCGADTAEGLRPKEAYHLIPGTNLKKGRYIVGRALGYGGFGVTYAAFDTLLQRRVAIKEYLPSEFATRTPGTKNVSVFGGEEASDRYIKGMQSFTDESERLAKFHDVEGIVRITDCFSENDTAYMVMELLDGKTVKKLIEEKGPLSYDETIGIILPVLDTLDKVHREGIIHRDISPDNIFLTDDGKVKLLDFGAARYATANVSKSLSVILKPGYAPEEQYRSRGDQGPWSDVYAAGATMYKMLTGITPDEALERGANDTLKPPSKLGVEIPKGAEAALHNALIVNADYRTRTAAEFANELLYGTVQKEPPKKRKPWSLPKWVYFALAGVLSLGAVLGLLLLTGVISFIDRGSIDKDASGNLLVPNLISMTEEQAKSQYGNWNITVNGSAETNEVGVGCIMAQDPSFGVRVPAGTTIYITVNRGLETEEGVMPFLRGSTIDEANEKLEGYDVTVEYIYDNDVQEGMIVETQPTEGSALTDGQQVEIFVSLGGLLDGVQIIPDIDVMELELGGEARELTAKPLPASTNEEKVEITWELGDASIAKYANGKVSAVSPGETVITFNASMMNEQTGETVTASESIRIVVTKPVELDTPSAEPTKKETETPEPAETTPPSTKPPTQPPTNPPTQPPTTPPVKRFTVTFHFNGGSGSILPIEAEVGKAPSALPTPSRTGFTFDGWYTAASGGTKVTLSNWNSVIGGMNENLLVSNGLTLYARWTVESFTVSWNNVTGCKINVRRTMSPYAGASTGTVSNGTAVYYGDVLEVTYTADTGYTVTAHGAPTITVTGPVTSADIWAKTGSQAYSINWSDVSHCDISVSRESSPNAGAYTGTLYRGDTVYYGDRIVVTYSHERGYSVTGHGDVNITVSGNVTSSDIWATVKVNRYTYNILYKSSNNYSLDTDTIEKEWGTTATVTAPEKSGYITPASQTVTWDSETPKTIVFIYVPKTVSSSQTAASGWWWQSSDWPGTGISYSVTARYQNRTATSVQIKLVWTQSIKSAYYGQNQYFNATIGGVSTGNVLIASVNKWWDGGSHYYTDSVTVETGWITVPAEATKTSVSINTNFWTSPSNWVNSSWSYNMQIPTY